MRKQSKQEKTDHKGLKRTQTTIYAGKNQGNARNCKNKIYKGVSFIMVINKSDVKQTKSFFNKTLSIFRQNL